MTRWRIGVLPFRGSQKVVHAGRGSYGISSFLSVVCWPEPTSYIFGFRKGTRWILNLILHGPIGDQLDKYWGGKNIVSELGIHSIVNQNMQKEIKSIVICFKVEMLGNLNTIWKQGRIEYQKSTGLTKTGWRPYLPTQENSRKENTSWTHAENHFGRKSGTKNWNTRLNHNSSLKWVKQLV